MFQDICCIVQGLSVTDIADIACIAHNIPTLRFVPPYIKRRTKPRKRQTYAFILSPFVFVPPFIKRWTKPHKRQTYTFILSPLLFVPLTKSHTKAGNLLSRGVVIERGITNTRTWNYLDLENIWQK